MKTKEMVSSKTNIKLLYILENPISNWVMDEIIEIKKYIKSFYYVSLGGYTNKYREKQYYKLSWKYILYSLVYIFFYPYKSFKIIKQFKKEIGLTIVIETFGIIHIIKKNNINHIHCHFASASTTSALILNKLININYSFTAHAYDIFDNAVNLNLLIEKMEKASFIRTISDYNKNYLINLSPKIKNKIHVIHCGINLQNFTFYNEIKSKHKNIISASNFVPKKGYINILETINKYNLKNINFHWKIAGQGPDKEKIKYSIDDANISNYVIVKPFITHSDLPLFFKNNDIFFLPCTISQSGNRDGIPVILMEAMASGILVISTSISGIPELIHNGKNGFILDKPSINSLITLINNINKLPADKIKEIKLNARRTIENDFNILYIAKELSKLFEKCA